jgi:DNA-binding XRE family transcriptional regulator
MRNMHHFDELFKSVGINRTMRDFSLLAAQIRAARGLLGWSQSYLADAVAVNRTTVVNLESGKREPHEATLTVLMSELAAAGIVFTERGVEFRKWPPKPYVPTGIKHTRK